MEKIESLKRKFETSQTAGMIETELTCLIEQKRLRFKHNFLRVKLSIEKIEEHKIRKLPSLLNIDSRPCVRTETQKHQKLIDQSICDSPSAKNLMTKVKQDPGKHVLRMVSIFKSLSGTLTD